MAVLYRKYRPQSFAEVLDQKHIVQTLLNQVGSGKVAHAYLFTGSRGVGKTSVARILAKAVNCLNSKNGEPCNKCEVCKQFSNGNFLDLVEIDAASNTGVDNIRDLIEHVKFSPAVGKFKVFIIDEVHMLSKGAFNALLKTLEEPPKHAIFVLATTEIYKVPATIISRTQRFDFKRLPPSDLERHLKAVTKAEKFKVSDDVLQLVAQHAEGSVRDSLSLLDKILTLGEDPSLEDAQQIIGATDIKISQTLLDYITAGSLGQLPKFIDSLLERGTDFIVLNRDFLEYLRELLVYKMTGGATKPDFEEEHLKSFENAAQGCSTADIIFYLRLFLRSYKELDSAPSPEIPFLLAACEAALKHKGAESNGRVDQAVEPTQKLETAPTEKKPTIAKQEQAVESGPALTLEELTQAWPEIISRLKVVNSPLANLIKSSPIVGMENGNLILSVKFLFHKQSLENPKSQAQIGSVIKEVCGKKARILAQVSKVQEDIPSSGEILNEALRIFGGEEVS